MLHGVMAGLDRANGASLCARVALLVLAVLIVSWPRCSGAEGRDQPADLRELVRSLSEDLEPGELSGSPPALEIRRGGRLYGYAYSTMAVTGSLGYAGRPLDVHVVLTADGRIAAARLARHEEPILVIGIAADALEAFVRGLHGIDIRQAATTREFRRGAGPDHVAGATVSSAVIRDAVLRSARAVARSRGLLEAPSQPVQIDRLTFTRKSWPELMAEGAIAHRVVRRGDVAEAFGPPAADEAGDLFIELYAAVLSPPAIGQSLIGRRAFERLEGELSSDGTLLLVAARGLYSFKGTEWTRSGAFDRIQIVQGANTIRLSREQHENRDRLTAEGAPELREIGLFRLPGATGFDPAKPWRLELLVADEAEGRSQVLALDHSLPAAYLIGQASLALALHEPPEEELWQQIWRSRRIEIAMTAAMLLVLAGILFAHDGLVRNVRIYQRTRAGFLAVTVVFLGLYAGAQLSVVNVITFAHAVLSRFHWEQFLADPLIFILWSFVALSMLFWGRGVFCGWLCPFGALQELLNVAARRLGIRQIELPWPLHERLWPIKYIAFLLILGISFKSIPDAFALAEIEPFKTIVVLKLARAWPFVVYAIALLAAGLFIERFYCRYVCPLGAALAIPARLRLFEWLKRRPQCGRECRICAVRCTVQAINPLGQIVPNECIYCLKCQASYYDATTCLPLKQRAQRRAVPAFALPPAVKHLAVEDADA
ncbi:MAG: NosR/NirI family protein [Hyphomicrobiaceae bacterium]|nr:NosR/NirI family protein [Hyphomicrobiaceae bacterium]